MPDVICESMDGVETQVSVKKYPLVSKAPFISEVLPSTARPGKVSLTRSLFSDDAVLPHLLRTDTFSHKIREVSAQSLEETNVAPIFRKENPRDYKLYPWKSFSGTRMTGKPPGAVSTVPLRASHA